MSTVLIADDDPTLLDLVTMLLEASGYEVEATRTAAETLDRWPRAHPDLVILDLHMPGGGISIVERIKRTTSIPVIVLSADSREEVKVAALDAGADDYVTKPFSATELMARVRVALRRTSGDEETIVVGPLRLSGEDLSASVAGASAHLTRTEFDLLRALARHDGFVATAELLNDVWGPAYRTELDYVRVYVRRLRSKLDAIGLPRAIESRPGLGYRLAVEPSR